MTNKKDVREAHWTDAVRLTIRLDEDTNAAFKTLAAIKRMRLEELGRIAILDLIKKEKGTIKKMKFELE